jgi:hypothetical protein
MSEIKRIGIDTSKAVFTLHAIDQADRPVLRVNLRRTQFDFGHLGRSWSADYAAWQRA